MKVNSKFFYHKKGSKIFNRTTYIDPSFISGGPFLWMRNYHTKISVLVTKFYDSYEDNTIKINVCSTWETIKKKLKINKWNIKFCKRAVFMNFNLIAFKPRA